MNTMPRDLFRVSLVLAPCLVIGLAWSASAFADARPHIVLVMADDQGWGQTGYFNHPLLKTPNLDAMAEEGLRLDRFYAGAPVCSPTRASVLTGRANDRTGVESHGYALRRQEITIAAILGEAGYVTGHFGKWHLNAMRGPGVPILEMDTHSPGKFGFQDWVSVTNFFDRDPIMSRLGTAEEFRGDSSEIVVTEALKFIGNHARGESPTFTVIWYGTPHSPFRAADEDMTAFVHLDKESRNHYGELVAMDRSIGTLRRGLRELQISDETLVWFCSDNGGLAKIKPETVGGLRGNKGTIYEGGLRVPAIIEWPEGIPTPRVTKYPASVLDIVPTLLELTSVSFPDAKRPLDGISLLPLFDKELGPREKPIPFRHTQRAAWIDNEMKLLTNDIDGNKFELYDLEADPTEANDLSRDRPEMARRMQEQLLQWSESVDASFAGKDYPEGRVDPFEPKPRFWTDVKAYEPFFEKWRTRWEYRSRLAKQDP